ncbi:glycosyltransferase [Roseinatronobacter thiooxidans]|uniref:glycosyltransferase n=1 Tax=Roseinatronobacter thiooxidans TaxID=121821 RepID=UPI000A6B25E1|nr:glycosyltransferase [Roseinatronobacter thiooxidans]
MSDNQTTHDDALVEVYGNLDLPAGTPERPLVTFALFAYNQEKYIREAVEGALAQTYEPLEIILSDDCSSDRTFEIMREVAAGYSGPSIVLLRRNHLNLGISTHFSKIINESRGKYFVVAAGDDISLPDRVSTLVGFWKLNKNFSFIDTGAWRIDAKGELIKSEPHNAPGIVTLESYLKSAPPGLNGATRGYLRDNQCKFGYLSSSCPTEDTPSILRGLLSGDGLIISRKLVKYRVHSNNLSGIASLRNMRLEGIFAQYRKDLCSAKSRQLLADCEASSVNDWIEKTKLIRMFDQKIMKGEVSRHDIIEIIKQKKLVGIGPLFNLLKKALAYMVAKKRQSGV